MTVSLVVVVAGADRPGVLDRVSSVIAARGGNWEHGQFARLAGRFAGIVEVAVPEEGAEALEADLKRLGLTVDVQRVAEPAPAGETLAFDVTAADRPGIVRDLTAVLAKRGVNVERLETRCESAPHSGERMFHARLDVRLPPGTAAASLTTDLEKLADELVIDLTLTAP